jgi:hypothetical protein
VRTTKLFFKIPKQDLAINRLIHHSEAIQGGQEKKINKLVNNIHKYK